ncbi:MAG: thiolase family protein [Chloroflexaceae bacterium]|nr:thiolase family protein [Chloroflexaceae bacterium]
MPRAVITHALRTPIGRYGGALASVRPDDLAALVIRALVARSGIEAALIEDVLLGCANQAGEDNRNVARMAALLAGLPVTVPGQTINRLCGSGMQAVMSAAQAIAAGEGEVFVAGGVESMTRAPFVFAKSESAWSRQPPEVFDTTIGWRFTNPALAAAHYPYSMGETAENIAASFGIGREEQDAFALESQRRYAVALAAGRFAAELVPVPTIPQRGEPRIITTDEHPRPDTSPASLAQLRPAFGGRGRQRPPDCAPADGSVTAGNSSGINDGAAALLLMSAERAAALGHRPLARIVSSAVAGVDPAYMGLGPVPAVQKALQRARLTVAALDLVEINEAFAVQVLACARELKLDLARVNVNGGAIALGHPLGASGARILATLVHELGRRGGRYGLATMCIGVGQGIAVVVEHVGK